ncbi:unnamed protein product [Rhizoctonia solani]|uniref:Uncharacterized protein n=1 Tax=Rhizoctonia solani TaxID=456999 RepID=A0A8H3BY02_9AGAM|nr:unnamed protein product [Rhizoctonia solani]
MSTTTTTASRASSLPPSKCMRGSEASSTMAWTTAAFLFPPHTSLPTRTPIPPHERSKSCKPQSSPRLSSTSRVINHIPGFDDFAELVVSERAIPQATASAANKHSSSPVSRSRHVHSRPSSPSESSLNPTVAPVKTTTIPRSSWLEDDNDTDRVTFVFGRFNPSSMRQSTPPFTQTQPNTQIRT